MDMVGHERPGKAAATAHWPNLPEPIEKVGVIGRFAKNIPTRSMPSNDDVVEKARQIEAVGEVSVY